MEKITEKLLLEKGTPKTNKLEQIKTLKLGLKCQDLPGPLLGRLTSLERLDLSGNCLKELPRGLLLPALSSLDLSNNEMEDVTTLESLVSMEELKMEDNLYITVNDNYKLMVLLPNLRMFNAKDISTTANHMRYVYSENLRTRIIAVWGSNFSLPDPPTKEKMAALERDFIKTARLQVKFGPNSISDYTRWRVERIAKEYLRSLTEPKEQDEDTGEATDTKKHCSMATPVKRKASTGAATNNVSLTPRKITRTDPQSLLAEASPRKSSRLQLTPESQSTGAPTTRGRGAAHKAVQAPLTPKAVQAPLTPKEVQAPLTPRGSSKKQQPEERQQQAKDRVMEVDKDVQATVLQTDVASPRKQSCRKMEERLSLKPIHVLQCHGKQDSREDFTTQLWACAFQPSLGQDSSTATGDAGGSRLVATCGGDTVCLIDCETGLVMKKYKVPGEELFSLAWSTVLMSREGGGVVRPCSILAVAGKRGLVKLIHPRANVAYGEFRASRKALSVLHFSPRQGNFLFTGSYDHKIVLWDIGGVDSQYNYKVIQLLVLETTATPLHICLPPNSPTTHLLSACEDGLFCYNIQLDKNTMKRSAEMEITFPIYKQEDKDHNYHTIDSLRFLTDDILASKCYMQSSIYLWSWSKTQAQRHNKRTTEVCAVVLAELQWANTEIPYLALNTCPREAVVVCGDDKGQLWTYRVTNLLKAKSQSGSPIDATEVLKWPSPVLTDRGPVEGPTINNVAMDPDLRYLVALTDKNMVVVWKRANP